MIFFSYSWAAVFDSLIAGSFSYGNGAFNFSLTGLWDLLEKSKLISGLRETFSVESCRQGSCKGLFWGEKGSRAGALGN